ncbi:3-beta-glucanase 1) (Exo-1 [Durusdinium trenchii]|uniref:3-beta-glucanase 1) (Exo-1 n=1 Tax=Durusdinium trenchii TaxID=1381693 RepID=A0ABP0IAY5_9DINO
MAMMEDCSSEELEALEGGVLKEVNSVSQPLRWAKRLTVALIAVGSLCAVGYLGVRQSGTMERMYDDAVTELFTMPKGAGVNLGGWLVLEDWFFSGSSGSFVMSQKQGQGQCLPPRLSHADEPWPSEGVLAHHLNATKGQEETLKIFEEHRKYFMTDFDLDQIAQNGISTIRLPLTWAAFADALAPLDGIYSSYDPERESTLVPDPFYHDKVSLVTIPRELLAKFLRKAAEKDLKVIFDLHSFPGGSQDGTYNSIWPNKPVFWREHSKLNASSHVLLSTVGRWVVQGLISWVEQLDEKAKQGVQGLTLMNEPAHTNAWSHFAQEEDVLAWLATTAEDFRNSKLPKEGVKLYVNIIETAFSQFEHSAVPWFDKTFTKKEKETWAVADVHWYVAWSNGYCDGRTVEGGGFNCASPLSEVQGKLRSCAVGASQRLRRLFGPTAQVAVTEFSAGTFHMARYACHNSDLLRTFVAEEVNAFRSVTRHAARVAVGQETRPGSDRGGKAEAMSVACGERIDPVGPAVSESGECETKGFGLAFLGHEVLLTDIGEEQAAATQGNIAQNQATLNAVGGRAQYGHLDWRTLPERSRYGRFDMVLGSDVIWHESLVEPFLQAVAWATSGPGAEEVILSHKARDQESIDLFHKMLGPLGLRLAKEVPSEEVLGEHGHPDVKLYHLQRATTTPGAK